MGDNYKCNVEHGFCSMLEKFTDGDGHTKGLNWCTIMSAMQKPPFEAKTIGVVYKRNVKDRGVFISFCPFCGEDLRPFREKYLTKKEKENAGA